MVLISKFAYKDEEIWWHTPLPPKIMPGLETDILYLVKDGGKKTTGRYTHVANTTQSKILSPLDRLDFGKSEIEAEKPP